MGSAASKTTRPLPVAHGENLVPGVTLTHLEPGGVNGPDDVVLSDVMGGLVWQDLWYLGSDDDDFRMCIPVTDGDMTLGDRHLGVDDIVITEPHIEVPEAVAGPNGAQLLELCRTAAAETRMFD